MKLLLAKLVLPAAGAAVFAAATNVAAAAAGYQYPCCVSIPVESSAWIIIHIELHEHCSSRSDQRSFSC